MDLGANFPPLLGELAADFRHLSPTGAGRLAWMAQDLHPSGACGDATDADAERGRALVDHAAQTLVELLVEIDRYPLERLRPRRAAPDEGP
jgi:creatinine amidohydrolase